MGIFRSGMNGIVNLPDITDNCLENGESPLSIILDGKKLADTLTEALKQRVYQDTAHTGLAPCMATILIGKEPASHIYVANKRKACTAVGIQSLAYELPHNICESELFELIENLNQRVDVHGILVQLPVPEHINSFKLINLIHPQKDVDGFHPVNIGRLATRQPLLRPCTPKGIMTLLAHYGIDATGKNVVIIGASNIVGRPMALEMLLAGATVTVCHRFTRDLESHVRRADILISATGVANIVSCEWLHERQVVVDVGIHRDAQNKIRGDIDFEQASKIVAYITPVPGGIGPMTVVSLLDNLVCAYHLQTRV